MLHELCYNVYFQPPTGTKLKYPCIVYELDRINKVAADNRRYTDHASYSVKYITRDPDDEVIRRMLDIPTCSMGTSFPKDNLYHYTYTIYH